MSFELNKYVVVKNAISKELADFCFEYLLLKRRVYDTYRLTNFIDGSVQVFGYYTDQQVKGTFSFYGFTAIEILLQKLLNLMEEKTNTKLMPTYSYGRIYKKGDVLERHKDRPSCEISTTLNLGGDFWPIFVKNDKGEEVEINLSSGDMLIYRGCDLEHWRNEFNGNVCAQVFLHYNNLKNGDKYIYDRRPHLGLPSNFIKTN